MTEELADRVEAGESPRDECPVCGARGQQLCSTVTGRDHKARWNR